MNMKPCDVLDKARKKYKNKYIILFSESLKKYCIYESFNGDFIGTITEEYLLSIENVIFPFMNDKGTPIKYLCPLSSENEMKKRYIKDTLKEYKFNELIENFNCLLKECWSEDDYMLFYGNSRFVVPISSLSLEECKEEVIKIARIISIHLLAKIYPSYSNLVTTVEGVDKAYLITKIPQEKLIEEMKEALKYLRNV